jgi:hypothetical protein
VKEQTISECHLILLVSFKSKIEKLWGWESPFDDMVVSYTSQNPCPTAEISSNFYRMFSAVAEVPELIKY